MGQLGPDPDKAGPPNSWCREKKGAVTTSPLIKGTHTGAKQKQSANESNACGTKAVDESKARGAKQSKASPMLQAKNEPKSSATEAAATAVAATVVATAQAK